MGRQVRIIYLVWAAFDDTFRPYHVLLQIRAVGMALVGLGSAHGLVAFILENVQGRKYPVLEALVSLALEIGRMRMECSSITAL